MVMPQCPQVLLDALHRPTPAPNNQAGAKPVLPASKLPASGIDPIARFRLYLEEMGVCHPEPDHPHDASTHLFKAACAGAVGFDLGEEATVAILLEWDRGNAVKPYPEAEIHRQVRNALERCDKPKGYLLMDNQPGSNGYHSNGQAGASEPPNQQRKSMPEPEYINAAELLQQKLPEPKWAVPGIVPAGLSILAGKPKIGKSWLMLNYALAVNYGGTVLGKIQVPQGDVLYLALEDRPRRLQDRLKKIVEAANLPAPSRLTFATNWLRANDGGLENIAKWLKTHPEARLVLIDTWARFRPPRRKGVDLYQEDTEHGVLIKELADNHEVPIMACHHCRKLPAEDPFDTVSGTLGLTGAADAVLVLERQRGKSDGLLHITGRDVDDQELALLWDPQHWIWTSQGDASAYHVSKEEQKVIDLFTKHGKPLTPSEAAPLLEKKLEATKSLLWRMAQKGKLVSENGAYKLSASTSPATGATDATVQPD